jgi:hypothetical protein
VFYEGDKAGKCCGISDIHSLKEDCVAAGFL